MPVDLTRHLERLAQRVATQEFPLSAERMAEELRRAARRALGGDLTLSGGAGTVEIDGESRRGQLVVSVGGAYTLADQGRRTVRAASADRGTALRTPWGPRQSVSGSRSRGKQITANGARAAFRAGREGVSAEVKWGRD